MEIRSYPYTHDTQNLPPKLIYRAILNVCSPPDWKRNPQAAIVNPLAKKKLEVILLLGKLSIKYAATK